MVAGLGNPGPRYSGTRHNAGFLVLDELARRRGAAFRQERRAETCRAGGVTLLKPLTFMNLSGQAVQAALTATGTRPAGLLVVHDDLDLPLGRLRFRFGGGAGGQRGVRDIIGRVGPGFWRLKVGVSRPPDGWTAERWVLSRFRDDEQPLLAEVVDAAADALELALTRGPEAAMNAYNGLDLAEPDAPSLPDR